MEMTTVAGLFLLGISAISVALCKIGLPIKASLAIVTTATLGIYLLQYH